MNGTRSLEEAYSYSRMALPLMVKHNIPTTPMNYSVWYKYVTGSDSALSTVINGMREAGSEFTEENNKDLYQKFCSGIQESELIKLREELQSILMTVMKETSELTGQAAEYDSFISNSMIKLSEEDLPLQEIKKVISVIVDKTRILAGFGKAVQGKLKETTVAMEVLKKDLERVRTEALIDFLTAVPNRKAFDSKLAEYANNAAVDGDRLSLLIVDIDHFKKFNDTHGHLIGDEVLKFVAKKIREIIKGRDLLARFGGEEFAVLLPQTPLERARLLAESIRQFFARTKLKAATMSRELGIITVSIGVAMYRPGESLSDLIRRADYALYLAKNNGRNRISTESDHIPWKHSETLGFSARDITRAL